MMQRADESGNDRRAEEIFAEYLVRREEDPSYDGERLLAEHPSLKSELSAYLSGDRLVNRGLRSKRRQDGTTTRIDEHFGRKVDPNISLDSESDELESGSPMSDRLKKLRDRGIVDDRYVLTEFIGEGGQGAVHKAWDGDLRRQVAIKFLSEVDVETTRSGLPTHQENRLARFLEEAQITAQLQHPGIPPVHELGIDERGRVYFTMKFLRGETFAKAIERHHAGEPGWTLPGLLQVVVRVCETLSFAHARKVIHRDLKPQNILVGKYGEAYVMDWGLARIEGKASALDALEAQRPSMESRTIIESDRADEAKKLESSPVLTVMGQRIGTPPYMSPEQAAGETKKIDIRSDVYALGAILYQIYCGHPPYLPRGSRKTAIMVLDMVLEAPPTPIQQLAPHIPPEMQSIIEKAMARKAADRYPTVADLAADLKAFLEDRVVKAYPTGGWLQLRKWMRRHPTTASLSVVLATVTFAGVLLLAWQERRRADAATSRAVAEAENSRLVTEKLEAEKQLGDIATIALLRRDADAAWPCGAAVLPRLEAIAASARAVLAREPAVRKTIEELRTRSLRTVDGDFAFGDAADGARHAALIELQHQMHDLEPSLLQSIAARIAISRQMADESDAREQRWDDVRESISTDPRFASVRLPTIEFLEPLRRIPEGMPGAGLWEFWHTSTGAQPPVVDDKVHATGTSATIFVLLPPSTAYLGASTTDPKASRSIPPGLPPAPAGYLPYGEYTFPPLFVSIHEFTYGQAQAALRLMPDLDDATTAIRAKGKRQTLDERSLPIDSITWEFANTLCTRLGLRLPNDDEWEYFARSGSAAQWFCGDDPLELVHYANLADEPTGERFTTDTMPYRDGHSDTAPVGSFLPNAFGIHDVVGNVNEWTATIFFDPDERLRTIRGGSYTQNANRAYSAFRNKLQERNAVGNVGFRPVLSIP